MIVAYSVIPKNEQAPNLRAETAAIKAIMRQTMMLIEYAIETIEDLIKLKKVFEKKLTPLQKERAKLYKIAVKSNDAEKIAVTKERLAAIKSELEMVRRTVRDCDAIIDRDLLPEGSIESITLKPTRTRSR